MCGCFWKKMCSYFIELCLWSGIRVKYINFQDIYYRGISIKRTHYKADTSIRRTVWRGTDCFALRSNYLRNNLYQADISIKRTHFFCTNGVRFIEIPLYPVGNWIFTQLNWRNNKVSQIKLIKHIITQLVFTWSN